MAKMNFLDRAVAAVSPVRGLKRAAARRALEVTNSGYGNYGANLTKKSLIGWLFRGGSAKEDIEDNIDVLRQRSRDAYMGIPIATASLKTLRTNVVAGGLMPSPQIDAEYLKLSEEQAAALQAQILREYLIENKTPQRRFHIPANLFPTWHCLGNADFNSGLQGQGIVFISQDSFIYILKAFPFP